ncbi:MAG: DUF932 domain-containing protein [Burkholderiales bacterium]
MAHEVHEMAYTGAAPWHGLGQLLQPKQPIEVWQQSAGMNWNIEASPVRFFNGSDVLHSFPDQVVLHRSDSHAPLAVVSNRFQVVQPREILEFYRDLTEVSGFELETAGVLKGGKKFWALAKTNQTEVLKGGDTVNGYLLLATSCDGTLATTAQFTSVRVVCNNTLHIALGDNTGAVKVSHKTAFDAEAVKRQLGIAVSGWDGFMLRMRALADCKVTDTQAQVFLSKIFTIQGQPQDKAVNASLELFQGKGLGADLASSQCTAWGLVNSVTEYIDHAKRANSPDNRLDSAWFGMGANLKQTTWQEAVKMLA